MFDKDSYANVFRAQPRSVGSFCILPCENIIVVSAVCVMLIDLDFDSLCYISCWFGNEMFDLAVAHCLPSFRPLLSGCWWTQLCISLRLWKKWRLLWVMIGCGLGTTWTMKQVILSSFCSPGSYRPGEICKTFFYSNRIFRKFRMKINTLVRQNLLIIIVTFLTNTEKIA